MAAALNQQQQLKNEATKMAIRLPLFYGNKKEDTMNIKDFIISQLATLWDWEMTRRNAISLEAISEDGPWQCG
jgi:hypothetical protein